MSPTTEQRKTALRLANETRQQNAELRRLIRALPEHEARRVVVGVLRDPDRSEGAMPVDRLLTAIPRCGPDKVRHLLNRAGVLGYGKRVRELTPRQRAAVVGMVADPTILYPGSSLPVLEDVA